MERYMNLAVEEAKKAYKKNEVPVGAIIVSGGKIIAKAHNTRHHNHSVIEHAEIKAILKAAKKKRDWRLNDCDLYVTLKPCAMCETIIRESRIANVYYIIDKSTTKKGYTRTNIIQTIVCNEYKAILSQFFANKR